MTTVVEGVFEVVVAAALMVAVVIAEVVVIGVVILVVRVTASYHVWPEVRTGRLHTRSR
jgi:hypothetical protein